MSNYNETNLDIIEEITDPEMINNVQMHDIKAMNNSSSITPIDAREISSTDTEKPSLTYSVMTTTNIHSPGKGKSIVKTTTFGIEICPSNSDNHQQTITSLTQAGPSRDSCDACSFSDTSSAAGFKPTHYHAHHIQSPSRLTPYDHDGTHLEIQTLRHSSDKSNDKQRQCLATLTGPIGHDRSGSVQSDHSIEYLDTLLPPLSEVPVDDPIIIRGNGNMTLFGLSNSFLSTFPSALLGRVSREEFEHTMNCINHLLQQQHSTNAKFLLLGCLCCCCSLGCSLLWPTVALSKRTRNSLDKLLAMENSRLYNKLGLNWHLSKQQCHTNHSFMEYILVIDFLPKLQIYQPD